MSKRTQPHFKCIILKQNGYPVFRFIREFFYLHYLLKTETLQLIGSIGNDLIYADGDAYAKAKEQKLHTNVYLPHIIGDCAIVSMSREEGMEFYKLAHVSDVTQTLVNDREIHKVFLNLK